MEKKQKDAENQWCSNIEKSGGNSSGEVLKKRQREQLEREKAYVLAAVQLPRFNCEYVHREHEWRVKEQQVKIVERILIEENRLEKRKNQQPYMFTTPQKEKEKVC